jgi:hypothetical protein
MNINSISFGNPDANNEEKQLQNYFISTRAYLNAKRDIDKKIFYVGYRGAGKSALFNQLISDYQEDKNAIVIDINPKEFSYNVFKDMKHSFHNVKTTYSIAWEYTLLIQAFIEVSRYFKNNPNFKKNRENIEIISEYLIKNNYLENTKNLDIFFEYLRKIVDAKLKINFKVFEFEAGLKSSIENEKKLINLLHIGDLNLPKNALKKILVSHPIHMFLDELDTGWDNTEESKNYINGLFEAVYSLRSIDGMNVYVSLRQDMYNNLIESLTNAEKIRPDIEKLNWDKRSITNVIGKRILHSIPKEVSESLSFENAVDCVFEKGVFDYLISNTLQRPREVIEFCKKAHEEYVNRYISHYNSTKKIDKEIIEYVLPEFSINRLSDLCMEYQFEYPHLKTIFYSFEHLNAVFCKNDFLSELEVAILKVLEKNGELEWLKSINCNANELFEILFKVGFIKVFIPNEKSYLAVYETNILDFERIEKVQINDVFTIALKSKRDY